jgi:hypothetical protein
VYSIGRAVAGGSAEAPSRSHKRPERKYQILELRARRS